MEQCFKIIADGAADLGTDCARRTGVDVVPFYVSFDGKTYQKEIEELDIREFYQKMVDQPRVFPMSSMPSVQDYLDAFEPYVKEGIPVICICITEKFSGSYNSARTAAGMLEDTYPDAEITVIDSALNTVVEGMFVREAARMRENGMTYEETVDRLLHMRETGRIFFTVGGMSYLVHGGRVGKLMGLAAGTLSIRPLITMKEGEIFPSGLARSRKKSREKVLELIRGYLEENGGADRFVINVGYGYDYEEAVDFRRQVLQTVRACPERTVQHADTPVDMSPEDSVEIYQIGATVGVHTGPYPIGAGILKKYEYCK